MIHHHPSYLCAGWLRSQIPGWRGGQSPALCVELSGLGQGSRKSGSSRGAGGCQGASPPVSLQLGGGVPPPAAPKGGGLGTGSNCTALWKICGLFALDFLSLICVWLGLEFISNLFWVFVCLHALTILTKLSGLFVVSPSFCVHLHRGKDWVLSCQRKKDCGVCCMCVCFRGRQSIKPSLYIPCILFFLSNAL